MRISSTLVYSLPLFVLTLGLTLPPDLLSLRPRTQQQCGNAPATIAGSMLSPRNPSTTFAPALNLRMLPGGSAVVWCQPGSRTFVIVEMSYVVGSLAASSHFRDLLTACLNIISYEIETTYDGPIDGGIFERISLTSSLALHVWNANNHQITYGVLGAAVSALLDYMQQRGWGDCTFSIFDGPMQVGRGQLR
ncbi:MAG: hypothetical protein FRX48_01004 [Lasallia pustulata]|uniref:Uncharacterized protein n=1 Tax=Lasallia pustulata TaxID=136370 RepID=A0A5M8Q226_9LECA|nr:MAG: hypothetical protein FRX48_01004 [Lasallia pustulata]